MFKNRFPVRFIAVLLLLTLFQTCIGEGQTRKDAVLGSGARETDETGRETPLIRSVCQYDGIEGIARITSAAWFPGGKGNAFPPPSVDIVFTFIPANPERQTSYRFPNIADTDQRAKIYPAAAFVDRAGKELAPGASVRCVRNEITAGTCSPVVYSFPDYEIPE